MRLSDIKGERSLDIMADAMELAEILADDERITALIDDVREHGDDKAKLWRSFCKYLAPILRDERYKTRITSIMAAAAGVTYEEYAESGPMLSDLFELLTTDAEAVGFLAGSAASLA